MYCYFYAVYCVFVRWSNYVCIIRGCVVVNDFSIDVSIMCQCVFQFFNYYYIVVVSDNEIVMVSVVSMGGFFWGVVVFSRQCIYCVEFVSYFLVQFFVVVSKYDVLFVQLDLFYCVIDIVCGSCICGVDGVVNVMNFKWGGEVGRNVGCYCFGDYIWVNCFQVVWVVYCVSVEYLEMWGVVVGICNQVNVWVILVSFWREVCISDCLFYRKECINGCVVYKVYNFVVNEVSGIQFYVVLDVVMYVGIFQFLRESDF